MSWSGRSPPGGLRPGSLSEVGDELRPESLGLTVAKLEAQQLPAPVLIHPRGDDDSAGADLLSLSQTALEVSGVEVDVGAALQRPAQEGLHLGINVLTDAITCDLGLPEKA